MCASRFELLAKKDQDRIRKFVQAHPNRMLDPAEMFALQFESFRENAEGLRTRPPGKGYVYNSAAQLLASSMGVLASSVLQRAIGIRLLSDDVAQLAEAAFIASRLQYVSELARGLSSSTTACLHVFNVLASFGARDTAAASATIKVHRGPARDGHPLTVALCNAVTGIMTRSNGLGSIKTVLGQRRDSGYNQAMCLALIAIIDGNATQLADSLETMLKNYRRVFSISRGEGLRAYFPLQVHGVYQLAVQGFREMHGLDPPAPPASPLWDREFHEAAIVTSDMSLVARFSPMVRNWAEQLPLSLDATEIDRLL